MTGSDPSSTSGESPGAGLVAVYLDQRPALLRFLIARTRDAAEAEEILQDLWLRIREVPPGPIANPVGYLHRSALNLANDRSRARRQRVLREADWVDATTMRHGGEAIEDAPSAEAVADSRREAARVAAAITQMPEGAARVFRRHKLDGLTHAEVAAELGITKSAVEKHMAVALKHLLRALGRGVESRR